jgi:hypothetical protein
VTGTELLVVVPLPSWPEPFAPHVDAVPFSSIEMTWANPASIDETVIPPVTATGVVRCVLVPSPSWPVSLSPQQYATKPVVPHVNAPPGLIELNVMPPETDTGTPLAVVDPFPSSPFPFHPQQYAAPLGCSAQECEVAT